MRITPINSHQSFQSFYKLSHDYIGENTQNFIAKNYGDNVLLYTEGKGKDIFLYTRGDKKEVEEQLESSIRADKGKYWKARPLEVLFDQRAFTICGAIFKADKGIDQGKENWVDYTA